MGFACGRVGPRKHVGVGWDEMGWDVMGESCRTREDKVNEGRSNDTHKQRTNQTRPCRTPRPANRQHTTARTNEQTQAPSCTTHRPAVQRPEARRRQRNHVRSVVRRPAHGVPLQGERLQAGQRRQRPEVLRTAHQVVREGEGGQGRERLEAAQPAQAVVAEEELGRPRGHARGDALDRGDVLPDL